MNYPVDILALAGIFDNKIKVNNYFDKDENAIYLYGELLDDNPRICPHCNSRYVVIKDKEIVNVNLSNFVTSVPCKVTLVLKKRKYLCKKCKKCFTQKTTIVAKGKGISNNIEFAILNATKEAVSFSQVARTLGISEGTVRKIFEKLPTRGRRSLSEAIALDEKRFKSEMGPYVCIITNAYNGEIIDVLPGRTNDILESYFSKKSALERQKVKYVISDMYQGFRSIKKEFFPSAIHIIDFFHVSRLFTDAIQKIRKDLMRSFQKDSIEYKFLKGKWRLFLLNPAKEKNIKILDKVYKDPSTNHEMSFQTILKKYLYECKDLLEIYNLYEYFCQYVVKKTREDEIVESLCFIIDKAHNSTSNTIQKVGSTLEEYFDEIVNSYSTKNDKSLSNAIAESTNAKIQKLISNSNGIKTFKTLRKRILHLQKK